MIDLLLRDAELRPELFWWHGAIPIEQIEDWEREHSLRVPLDLKLLWSLKGSVDYFQSETILKPFGEPEYDLILECSKVLWGRGLSTDYCVFQTGLCNAVFRKLDGAIFEMEERPSSAVRIGSQFGDLGEWYESCPRRELW